MDVAQEKVKKEIEWAENIKIFGVVLGVTGAILLFIFIIVKLLISIFVVAPVVLHSVVAVV